MHKYYKPEEIQQAKIIDLLTYLRRYEPQELVHISGNSYCTRTHDSLKISNGKWYWFSRGIGGTVNQDFSLLSMITLMYFLLSERVVEILPP